MEELNNTINDTFFSVELGLAISALLEKYNLVEELFVGEASPEQELESPDTSENSQQIETQNSNSVETNGQKIITIAQDINDKIIKFGDIANAVEKSLMVSKKNAEEIANDIKLVILPIVQNLKEPLPIKEDKYKPPETQSEIISKLRPPIGSFPNQESPKPDIKIELPEKIFKKTLEIVKEKQQDPQKNDTYREPIE
jgi:DNA anti-recombination protein RmuC